jgi:aminomethyltransferase
VGLVLAGRRIARAGAGVLGGGRPAGKVTSGTFSPTLQKALAMAYVATEHAAAGTQLEVDVRGKPEAARVVPLPFYRRPKPGGAV